MNDDMKEKVSAFMDDELQDDVLVKDLESNLEAQSTLARYQLIADVLKRRYVAGSLDVSANVRSSLANEATIITPKSWFRKINVLKQAAGLAVAATVAAVALLVVGDFSSPATQQSPMAVATITNQPIQMTSAMQKKLNGYLVSHNEFSASRRMNGLLPYTRIASSVAGERVAVKAGVKLEK